MPSASENPQQQRDELVVKLLRHLFHDYFIKEEDIPVEQAGSVMPAFFFGWLDNRINLLNGEEICASLNVPLEIWHFVKELVESGIAVERLNQVWYAISLGSRPEPQHRLKNMNLILLLQWEDGIIIPVQVYVSQEMLSNIPRFTDGLIASIVSRQTGTFVNSIIEDGLDGLHDKGKNYRGNTPEDPFEVCMGLMLSPIKYNTLREDLKSGVEMYARLFQGICRPVLPPEIKAALAAKMRTEQQPKSQGGWDT